MNNKALAALTRQAAPAVLNAIKAASVRTGVDFAYMVEKAAAESSFNAKAESKTSSAAGLYQFIESTWLHMVKNYGARHGMGEYAAQIDDKGCVADPVAKDAILELRKDPEKASLLAAEFAAENKRILQQNLGPEANIGPVELYLAHFLGAGSASEFLKAQQDNSLTTAADLFPHAARANRNVFYDSKTGEARTLAGVYDFFAAKFGASEGGVSSKLAAPVKPAPVPASRGTVTAALLRQQMESDNRMLDILMAAPSSENRAFRDGFSGRTAGRRMGGAPGRAALSLSPEQMMVLARLEMPQRAGASYKLNN